MDEQTVKDVIACLAGERTLFSYFPGRYALMLLARASRGRASVRALRSGPFAPLLEKPLVKEALATAGCGCVSPADFDLWPGQPAEFLLALDSWGHRSRRRYHQTSRSGFNLVLQLNFNTGDMARFARLVDYPRDYNLGVHPCCKDPQRYRETLAWARMDVCFDTDAVLIEEIQSDFVRFVDWQWYAHRDHAAVVAFCAPFRRLWAEAMLSAAVEFVWRELGISTVYYHEFETGNALKGLQAMPPPRSLYEALPRRFCMALTTDVPPFLLRRGGARKRLRALRQPRFYKLTDPGEDHHARTSH